MNTSDRETAVKALQARLDAVDISIEFATFQPGADAPGKVAQIGNWQDRLGSIERSLDPVRMGCSTREEDVLIELDMLIESVEEEVAERLAIVEVQS